jgi:hypothetical protein
VVEVPFPERLGQVPHVFSELFQPPSVPGEPLGQLLQNADFERGIVGQDAGLRRNLTHEFFQQRFSGVVIEPVYSNAHWFKDGLAPVAKTEGKWGYINLAGKTVVPFRYDLAEPFQDGMGRIYINGLYGYLDVTGKLVIPPGYFVAEPFSYRF